MITTHSEAETIKAGQTLFPQAQGHSAVALVGELGAGKTQLVKGLALAAGFQGEVTSPTFSIVHEYQGQTQQLCHFDFYRIESEAELWELGWEDYLDRDAILAIEWADRFPQVLPEDTLWLHLEHQPDGSRHIQVQEKTGAEK